MKKNEDVYKKKLTDKEYKVLRKGSTEMPFTGELLHNKKKGEYRCKACGNVLFDSDAKFDSGTGWPSFDKAKPGSVKYKKDKSLGMERTEIVCAKCGSHLGHMFEDGPEETTGKRYCINSVCLNFKGKKDKKS